MPPRLRIEPRRRLIQKKQLWIAHQRRGHRQPLFLSARESAHARFPLLLKLRRFDRLLHGNSVLEKTAKHPQRLFHRQLLWKLRLLQLNPDALPQFLGPSLPAQPQHLHASLIGRGQSLANLDRRRLPSAIRPQQPKALAPRHLQVKAIHRLHIRKGFPKPRNPQRQRPARFLLNAFHTSRLPWLDSKM